MTVTVRQLFDLGHRLEVTAGSEVVWADPHFDRVWFPTGAESPKVERVSGGFRAMFTKPGTYRGAFNDMTMTAARRPGPRKGSNVDATIGGQGARSRGARGLGRHRAWPGHAGA